MFITIYGLLLVPIPLTLVVPTIDKTAITPLVLSSNYVLEYAPIFVIYQMYPCLLLEFGK